MKKRGKTGILNAVRFPGEGAEKTEIKSGKGCVCVLLQKLQRFMMGRYGGDKFSIFLLVSGLVLTILGQIFFWPVILLGDALYLYALFRMFSRNIPARQREYYACLLYTSRPGGLQEIQGTHPGGRRPEPGMPGGRGYLLAGDGVPLEFQREAHVPAPHGRPPVTGPSVSRAVPFSSAQGSTPAVLHVLIPKSKAPDQS